MRILAIVILSLLCLIILALLYYLVVGQILFEFSLSRKTVKKRVKRKHLDKNLKEHNIDLCWWDKHKFQTIKIQSFDQLQLFGHYYDNNSNKTVIIVHGFGQLYQEMSQYCNFFLQKNFNILAIECRAHNLSEGKCVGFGWLDRKDIISWIEFLNNDNPNNKILLFGLSMGASAVCCACGEKLPNNVEGAISDSAFANAEKQFDFLLKKYFIFGKFAKKHLFSFVKRVHGFDLKQANPSLKVKDTKIPILYIQGTADTYVPVENLYTLYNNTPENLRDKFLVEGAEHSMAYPVAGVLYEKKISDFIKSRTKIV